MTTQVRFQCFGVQCKRCEQWIALVNLDGMDAQEIEALSVPRMPVMCPQCFHQREYPADAGKLLLGLPERWGVVVGIGAANEELVAEPRRARSPHTSDHVLVPPAKANRSGRERRI